MCQPPWATIARPRMSVIEITAVGEELILAKAVTTRGVPEAWVHEAVWTLECRDWRVVGMTELNSQG